MKDKRGRPINDLIIEVVHGSADETIEEAKKNAGSRMMLCEELFRDGMSPEDCVPSTFAENSNSKYFGWQKVDLRVLDKDAYRPEGQRKDVDGPVAEGVDRYAISEAGQYDQAMDQVVWYRFVNDQQSYLVKCRSLSYRHSPGVKRMLLKKHGFEYCGKRISKKQDYRDWCGFTCRNYGYEVWAHEKGLIVAFIVEDGGLCFYEAATYAKIKGNYNDVDKMGLNPRGGSMVHTKGGTVVWYQSAPRNLWDLLEHPMLMQNWGEGPSGLEHLGLWTYAEDELYENYQDCSAMVREDVRQLAEKYPLLKRICC